MKVKVGVGDDAGRVAAVRAAAGPQVALRLDANGAWDVEQAVRAIDALAPAGLELVEEPVHGLQAVREVRERVAVRVAIDETAAEHGALGAGVADAVCLKISRCGGIAGLLAAATLVRASGAEVYLASTLDGPLGIAAACTPPRRWPRAGRSRLRPGDARAVRRTSRTRCRRATGAIAVPRGPGLGVEPLVSSALRRERRRATARAGFSSGRPCPPGHDRRSSRVGEQLGHALARAPGTCASRSPTSDRRPASSARRGGPTAAPSRPVPMPAQHRGERARAVAALVLARERADLGRVVGEQRLRAPALDELLEGHALELVGERVGRRAPRARARPSSSMPAVRRDEHQPRDALGRGQRDVQRDAPAQRVAAEREALGRCARARARRSRRR